MTTIEELKDRFKGLTDEEKMAFMKSVVPWFCKGLTKDPQKMMAGMMPFCREIMSACGADMQGMMKMMGMMGGAVGANKG